MVKGNYPKSQTTREVGMEERKEVIYGFDPGSMMRECVRKSRGDLTRGRLKEG